MKNKGGRGHDSAMDWSFMFMTDEMEKRIAAFFEFLGYSCQDIENAKNYLLREGLDPDHIEIPMVKIFDLEVHFLNGIDRPRVSAVEDLSHGMRISAILKKSDE